MGTRDFTTSMATFGIGRKIAGTTITAVILVTEAPERLAIAATASSKAAPGLIAPTISAPRSATGTNPITETAAKASALPEDSEVSLRRLHSQSRDEERKRAIL